MTKKMTYVDALTIAIEGMADGEAKEKLIALRAQQEKKNSGERKATKTQIENEALCERIMDWMGDTAVTASDVATAFEVSNQKASAMLKKLVEGGQLEKFVGEKRRTFFHVALA